MPWNLAFLRRIQQPWGSGQKPALKQYISEEGRSFSHPRVMRNRSRVAESHYFSNTRIQYTHLYR